MTACIFFISRRRRTAHSGTTEACPQEFGYLHVSCHGFGISHIPVASRITVMIFAFVCFCISSEWREARQCVVSALGVSRTSVHFEFLLEKHKSSSKIHVVDGF